LRGGLLLWFLGQGLGNLRGIHRGNRLLFGHRFLSLVIASGYILHFFNLFVLGGLFGQLSSGHRYFGFLDGFLLLGLF
jgi:hypothetical protein